MVWQRSSSTNLESTSMGRLRSRGESDPEKRYISDYEEDDEPPSAVSSRSTSSQHRPLMKRAFSGRSHGLMIRSPQTVMRYACWSVAAILIIFILSLVHMSSRAGKAVEVAIIKEDKPAVWEDFPFLTRYWGGVRKLVPRKNNKPEYPRDEDETPVKVESDQLVGVEEVSSARKRDIMKSIQFEPYPNYNSSEYITEYGKKIECFLDEEGTIRVPRVRVYEGIPEGFPDNVMGSAELLGMRNDICYDRFGRLGPYGLGYSLKKGGSGSQLEGDREGADAVWENDPEVDFRDIRWADVQQRCNAANAHRFKEPPKPASERFRTMQVGSLVKRDSLIDDEEPPADFAPITSDDKESSKKTQKKEKPGKTQLPRTAVVIRTWHDYQYTAEDLIYLRSLVSELNVLSGGEYTLHFLIQVKDDNAQIWSDDETYERYLHDALPEEFRGMGTLWTERQMLLVYGDLQETWMRDLPVHGVYRSTFMPMQYFGHLHPEYDFFWNWEMDARSTNHWYHLFDSISKWAKKQPRKYLWERNSRFYVPAEHGTWEDFSHMVRVQTEHGTNSANNLWSGLRAGGRMPGGDQVKGDRPIWGPERPLDDNIAFDDDPVPPTSFEKDKNTWGVGEDADLITFNPMFDPEGTTWLLADDVTGYNITQGRPPRRTAIITASRLSRKLLVDMHKETAFKRHTMFSEMWPASCALHHGLKAVYVPHAEYIDRRWPTSYLEKTFNGGRNGATGGSRTSVFGDREHNFLGTTYYYRAGFPEVLWHRWLGMAINNDGGEAFELDGEGRMCLPGILLHPMKGLKLVQEGRREGE